MFLIIGLGNPGKKYQGTRHNAGFQAAEEIVAKFAFPEFKFYPRLNTEIAEGIIAQKKVIIANPQTFMNCSGEAVKKLLKKWKINPEELIVMHDDLDIALGKIKISKNRGTAGHKGVESIVSKIASQDFCRIRIGIGSEKKPENPDKFVLGKLSKADKEILSEALSDAVTAVEIIVKGNQEKAANQFN